MGKTIKITFGLAGAVSTTASLVNLSASTPLCFPSSSSSWDKKLTERLSCLPQCLAQFNPATERNKTVAWLLASWLPILYLISFFDSDYK